MEDATDTDGDGMAGIVDFTINPGSELTPCNKDGDTNPNFLDLDSDADGIFDLVEEQRSPLTIDADSDGKFEVFPAIVVNNQFLKSGIDVIIKPNPTAADNISFEIFTGDENSPILMKFINISGKVVFSKQYDPDRLKVEDQVKSDQLIKSGLYFITVVQGENTNNLKVVIE